MFGGGVAEGVESECGGKKGKVCETGRQSEIWGPTGGGGWYLCLVDKRGSVMSGIMRPGHPSATCTLEMRDLVSSPKPLGVSWLRKGREVGAYGEGVFASQNSFTLLLLFSSTPPRPPLHYLF